MKKLALLLSFCTLLGGSICNANIIEKQDQFTGGTIIRSNCECEKKGDLDWISFFKTVNGSSEIYALRVDITSRTHNGLSEKNAVINIDGEFLSDLQVDNRKDMKISDEHLYMLEYKIGADVVGKIKESNRIAFKFTRNNGFQFVYVLPDDVLTEWKQVIERES